MLTYRETLKYLDSFVNYERIGPHKFRDRNSLSRLQNTLEVLDNPHRNYRSIHIAGTKGKGSVSTFTASILQEAGYRVGLFTSPHLISIRERIKMNGRDIGEDEFAYVANYLRKHTDDNLKKEFTFFEMLTLMAILHFDMKKVDFAVFEVGMGGRLDATNVINAEFCGISPISYDHMQALGDRLNQIAYEKAGIIKDGSYCISSPQRKSALDVIKKMTREKNAKLSIVGEDIGCDVKELDQEGSLFNVHTELGRYDGCHTAMLGDFQPLNSALAIGICEKILGPRNIGIIKKGIKRASFPGRIEVLSSKPTIVIDGAHNAASAERLRYSIRRIFRYNKLMLILGISQDKDVKGICQHLVPLADEIILTRAQVERAMDPILIKGYIRKKKTRVTQDTKEALGQAINSAGKNDLILIAGSFYLVGEVKVLIQAGIGNKFQSRLGIRL